MKIHAFGISLVLAACPATKCTRNKKNGIENTKNNLTIGQGYLCWQKCHDEPVELLHKDVSILTQGGVRCAFASSGIQEVWPCRQSCLSGTCTETREKAAKTFTSTSSTPSWPAGPLTPLRMHDVGKQTSHLRQPQQQWQHGASSRSIWFRHSCEAITTAAFTRFQSGIWQRFRNTCIGQLTCLASASSWVLDIEQEDRHILEPT